MLLQIYIRLDKTKTKTKTKGSKLWPRNKKLEFEVETDNPNPNPIDKPILSYRVCLQRLCYFCVWFQPFLLSSSLLVCMRCEYPTVPNTGALLVYWTTPACIVSQRTSARPWKWNKQTNKQTNKKTKKQKQSIPFSWCQFLKETTVAVAVGENFQNGPKNSH